MSKIDLLPLLESASTRNQVDSLLLKTAEEDDNGEILDENDFPAGIPPEKVQKFLQLTENYLYVRLDPKGDTATAIDTFVKGSEDLKLPKKYRAENFPRAEESPVRILSRLQSSFVGFGMIGLARPETTIVPDNPVTPGINESKRTAWDLRRYGIGIQKTWPVKKLESFPYLRYGWQASFTVFDGSMDYEGREVASIEGQSLSTSLLAGLEYPFNDKFSARFLASFGAEVGRFATTLNGLGGIPDKCSAPTGIPTTSQVVNAAECELANMLATYYSFPTMLTGGVKLYDTVHIDLSWQHQYLNNSPYVYSPEDLDTFWFTIGVDTD